jgi:hypothetical protein
MWQSLQEASQNKRSKLADALIKVEQFSKFSSSVRDLVSWIEVSCWARGSDDEAHEWGHVCVVLDMLFFSSFVCVCLTRV